VENHHKPGATPPSWEGKQSLPTKESPSFASSDLSTPGAGRYAPRFKDGAILTVMWCIRHWFLVLILVGGLIYAVVPHESDHPRSGYVDTGKTVTTSQCEAEGGTVVGDVCYGP
jgi:hypothetical protein